MMEWARKALAIGSPDVGGAKERGADRYERVPKVVKAVAKRGGLLTGRFVSGDHQGTASVQVDAVSHEVFKQRSLPFGGPRGSQASGWSGEKGFVGGTIDTVTTGLTHIGAREYDPDTGRFISVDPILDPTDPRQMNGYAYANHSPVTYSDPTGLFACDANGNCWADGVTPVGVGAAVTGPSAPKNVGKAVGSPAPKSGVVQRVSSTDPVQELARVATAGSPATSSSSGADGNDEPAWRKGITQGLKATLPGVADASFQGVEHLVSPFFAEDAERARSAKRRADKERGAKRYERAAKAVKIVAKGGGLLTVVVSAAFNAQDYSEMGFDKVDATTYAIVDAGIAGLVGFGVTSLCIVGTAAIGTAGCIAGGVVSSIVAAQGLKWLRRRNFSMLTEDSDSSRFNSTVPIRSQYPAR